MSQTEARIQNMAVTMVAYAIRGRKVSKAEKVALMTQALTDAERLVAKMGA